MEDIGTNINSPTCIIFLVAQGHETGIGFVDVLLPDFPLPKLTKIVKGHICCQICVNNVLYSMSLQQALWNTSIIQTPWSQDYSDYN